MAKEEITARFQLKDENNNAILDDEGKATWQEVTCTFDFGDDLDQAVELCGAEVVHSQYKANSTVAAQGIMRAKLKAGMDAEAIQATLDAWKPGMVVAKTQIDPATAIQNAFGTWSDEKKAEFLAKLGIAQ